MKTFRRMYSTLFLAVGVVVFGMGQAWADGSTVYDWPSADAPVLVENASGLIFIGPEGQPVRAFSWRSNDGERDRAIRLTDMEGDGVPNIVGSGTPTFILSASGEPISSFEQGCRQVLVANLVRRSGQNIICVRDREIQAYTGDGQLIWAAQPGRNIDWCRTGDITGDARHDVECKYRGRDTYLRLGSDGTILTESSENQSLEDARESIELHPAVGEAVWTGGERFDLDGDGSATETIHAVDGAIEFRKGSSEEAFFRVEIDGVVTGVVAKDVTGDGSLEVVAVTESRIYVISQGGESVRDFSANAGQYRRVPYADLTNLFARGFGDADEDAREAVRAIQENISQCYGTRLRAHPMAGSGRQMLRVFVGTDGSVANVNQTASQVGDRQVENCARQALERASYPAAEEEDAAINITITFTFRDEER